MKTKVTLALAILFCFITNANNITVSNISLENLNEPNWVQVEFDLSWENSWRLSAGPSNWDAAWVFIKYRANSGEWNHVQLALTDFVAPAGSTIDITSDGVGAFIYRDTDGSGDLNLQNVRLRWNYALNGVNPNDILDIQVFAIEMVYIPEGSFYVGGTASPDAGKFHEGGSVTSSYQITSEALINVSNTTGNLYYDTTGELSPGDLAGPIPASFPKGFNDFYIMKYEVSHEQYIGFFNALTEVQKTTVDISVQTGNRHTIVWPGGSSSATTTTPDRALNFLSTSDATAYLDWTGLRHITEFEYEKACRGHLTAKPGEFAWGNANITATAYTIINDGTPTAQIANMGTGTGNAYYGPTRFDGITGPVRNGIFAASAINKNREETGGSYYGVMELSGNVWEQAISVGNPNGRSFSGLHGDGSISALGEANVANWPTATAEAVGVRGGGATNPASDLRISNRRLANLQIASQFSDVGFRGGRTAD
jgi:formylglycine-generating enzyme required for sulfatase activity